MALKFNMKMNGKLNDCALQYLNINNIRARTEKCQRKTSTL